MADLIVMISRTGRSVAHNDRRFQGQSTGEAHHLVYADTKRTLCGRDASDWFGMDAFAEARAAAEDVWCCQRCASRYLAEREQDNG